MDPLTLFVDSHWISPYAMSAFVALEEKGLPYTVKELSLPKKEHQLPGYGAHTGRLPALQHGDFWLAESQAIAEYLAETFPFPKHPRLFPEDLKERAICREVMAWVRSDLLPIREERSTYTVWYERTTKPLSDGAQKAVGRLLAACDRLIAAGRTTLFDAWCLADVDLAMMLQRLNVNGDPLPPKVKAFAEANWQRPSVRKWCERQRPAFVPY
ncbi:MAG: glutathione transferase [Myxococcaceae bacterium]|nr:glutathione transferase [Myxococcaceae bacterium]